MVITLNKPAQYLITILTIFALFFLIKVYVSTYKAEFYRKKTQRLVRSLQYDKALEHLAKAENLQPRDARIAYQQGRINDVLYRFRYRYEYAEAAIAAYQRAINLNPLNGFHYDGLGWVYLRTNNYEQALVNFQEALSLDPHRSDYLYAVGKAYENIGEFDQAMNFYKQAVAIKPKHPHGSAKKALEQLKNEVR